MIGQPCVCVDVVSRVGLNSTINVFCVFGVGTTSGGVGSARSVRVRLFFSLAPPLVVQWG